MAWRRVFIDRPVLERGRGEVITNAGRMGEPAHAGRATALVPGVAWIVEEQPNPSTDYYVAPALRHLGFRVVRSRFDDPPNPNELTGAVVVFVRYVSPAWRTAVDTVRDKLAAVVYFMDDDLLDVHASVGLSARYRWKIWRMATRHQKWLGEQRASLWVSTESLAIKYTTWAPRIVRPSPLPTLAQCRRIFYHGSESHLAEIEWLVPVIGQVLADVPDALFEVIGGSRVRKLYAGIPRVTVIHPMKWPTYIGFQALGTYHVGLAPLMDTRFNAARSHTRFLDYTRMGAAGIYSESSANAAVVTPRHDGMVVPMDRKFWIRAIHELLADETLRSSIVANATATATRLAQEAAAGYPVLLDELSVPTDQRGN